jgi:hypothetical protein
VVIKAQPKNSSFVKNEKKRIDKIGQMMLVKEGLGGGLAKMII